MTRTGSISAPDGAWRLRHPDRLDRGDTELRRSRSRPLKGDRLPRLLDRVDLLADANEAHDVRDSPRGRPTMKGPSHLSSGSPGEGEQVRVASWPRSAAPWGDPATRTGDSPYDVSPASTRPRRLSPLAERLVVQLRDRSTASCPPVVPSGPARMARRGNGSREGLDPTILHPVVVGVGDLGRYVVLLEAKVRGGRREDVRGRPWRQPTERGT